MTFADLAAHPTLQRALRERNYHQPTPIQAAVLDPAHAGRDVIASSQTGSGKTVAFGLALAPTLLGEAERLARAGPPLALVIAPTRELAMQVSGELGWLYAPAGARIVACVGGMDARREAKALQNGAHFVVGTPGRLCDHLERRNLDLSRLRALVLDEADEMLDMGFRDELERILRDAPAERTTMLFSATIPAGVADIARRYQRDAVRIRGSPHEAAHQDIEYRPLLIAPREREHAVVNTLRLYEPASALVFCATREAVKHLQASLAERGFQVVGISGELSQPERTRALHLLRDGRAQVLVATDVAARGLDLPDISLVIHADLPRDAQVLQHRSGRTGRAGRKGVSVLLVPAPRRRAAEGMLRQARIDARFAPPPSADEVRKQDRSRVLGAIAALAGDVLDEDLALADKLLEDKPARALVAALVRSTRERRPAPEDLPESLKVQTAAPKKQRTQHLSEGSWFAINLGRERGADMRWMLPLLCRVGGVTRAEIGKIVIEPRETRFEIAPGAARKFELAAQDYGDPKIRVHRAHPPKRR